MTPEQLAARWLADVDVYADGLCEMDEVIAAIARHLAPGDDLVAQAEKFSKWCRPNREEWDDLDGAGKLISDMAARLSALTAENRESVLQALASMGQAQDAYEAQLAAEAEVSRLRDRLARMEGALTTIDALDPEGRIGDCSVNAISGLVLRMGEIARAALTETPADGGKHE